MLRMTEYTNDFILRKIYDAKRLLRYTVKSITAISDYLGFLLRATFRMYSKNIPVFCRMNIESAIIKSDIDKIYLNKSNNGALA